MNKFVASSAHAEALWCEGHQSQRAFDRAVLGRAGTELLSLSGEDGCVLESPRPLLPALCVYKTWHMICNCHSHQDLETYCSVLVVFVIPIPLSPCLLARISPLPEWLHCGIKVDHITSRENQGASESSFSANTTATYRLNVLLFGAVIRSHKSCLAESTHCLHAHFLPVRCWVKFCEMVLELLRDEDSV